MIIFPPLHTQANSLPYYVMGCGSSCANNNAAVSVRSNSFCDSLGPTNEEAASAHEYVAGCERRRASCASPPTKEPSAFASALTHRYAVTRAFFVNGINSKTDQFDKEVQLSVPPFHYRRRQAVEVWLKSVDSPSSPAESPTCFTWPSV